MFDPFLLLTPILVLAVLALIRFVGCDQVLGLERPPVHPPPSPGAIRVSYGNGTITLTWGASTGATGYRIKEKDNLTDTYGEGTFRTDRTFEVLLPYQVTRYYVVVAVKDNLESAETNEVTVTGARSLLTHIEPGTPQSFFNGWVGMRIRVGAVPLHVVALGRIRYTIGPPETPISQAHEVKIVDSTGVNLPHAEAWVLPQSGIVAGHFRYQTLEAAVDLEPNTIYFVVSHETARSSDPAADEWYDFDTRVFSNTEASVTEGMYQDDAAPGAYQVSTGGAGHAYVPVDILYHPKPVP